MLLTQFSSVQLVTQSCPTLSNPMDCSTIDLTVLHYLWSLLKFMSIESVMPFNHLILCRPLLLSSIFLSIRVFSNESALCIGDQSIGDSASALVLPMSIQDWFALGFSGLISLLSKGFSRVFFNTTAWKHQFFSAQSSLWSNSHIHT